MPSTDRKLELKAKTSMAQTASQAAVFAKGLTTTAESPLQTLYLILETAIHRSFRGSIG
jgi:hypothetical protein